MSRRPAKPAPRRLSLGGVVAAKDSFLREIERLADGAGRPDGPLFGWAELDRIRRDLGQMGRRVAELCAADGLEPADLAAPSRRAFQLISYLASEDHLERHMGSLRSLLAAQDGAKPVAIRLDHTAALYRIEHSPKGSRLLISEGFAGAPEGVLQALVRLATPYARKREPRRLVRDYSEGPGYASTLRRVEASGGAYRSRPAGEVYDLGDVFDAVNRERFHGELTAPRLLWSERVPSVEFGHYEPASDTVRLSRRLDSPDVPRYVLEHVMHHELLHRVLGGEALGGRRVYHSPRFRREERRFPRYHEAEEFLRRMAAVD
jgi:hypothetical protein